MHKSTNGRKRILTAVMGLALGLCMAAPAVRAQELRTIKPDQAADSQSLKIGRVMAGAGLSSRGNLVYREGTGGAQIYESDFLLLKAKLDTIPDEPYEPAAYAIVRQRKDVAAVVETYSSYYEPCGDYVEAPDLVCTHQEGQEEACTFTYDGREYAGRRYMCVCGYQWEQEAAHTLLFEPVDGIGHRSRCRLEGTAYCPGYEPVVEEHYAYNYKSCADGRHHEKICMDCGYREEEECSFSMPAGDGGGEDGGRCCRCGNMEKPAAENHDGDEEEVTGEEKTEEDVEAGEERADEEPEKEKPDTEANEEMQDTEAEEEKDDTEPDEGQPDSATEGDKPDAAAVEEQPTAAPEEDSPDQQGESGS